MKHPTRIALLCTALLALPVSVRAQVDTAAASLHRAGPDALYIDRVLVDGTPFAFTIERSAEGLWEISAPLAVTTGELPADVVLDFASVSALSAREYRIEDVLVGTTFYSGTIALDPSQSFVERYRFEQTAAPLPEDNQLLARLLAIYADLISEAAAQVPHERPQPSQPPGEASREQPEAPLAREEAPRAATAEDTIETPSPSLDGTADAPLDAPAAPGAEGGEVTVTVEPAEPRPPAAGDLRAIEELLARYARAAESRLRSITSELDQQSARLRRMELQLEQLPARSGPAHRETEVPTPTRATPSEGSFAGASALSPTASLEAARALLGPARPVDLTTAQPTAGNWRLSRNRAVQDDPDALFAKLRLPFDQDGTPRLYRFLARSLDSGWTGVGLHFAVAGVERPAGYGHGQSILVWLTRDPPTYGVQDTFVEVYLSSDDVNMDRVAQARSPSRLSERTAVEILFDPGAGFLTMAVNGVEYLRYRLTLPPGSSAELTVRALGRVAVEDLEVRAVPAR